MTGGHPGEPEDDGSRCSFELEALEKIGITDDTDPLVTCLLIQNNAHRIPIRMKTTGEWRDTVLSEMPPRLAVWWAIELVKWNLNARAGRVIPSTE